MSLHIEAQEVESYVFKEMPTKIVPKADLKKHKNSTRTLWTSLEEKGWELLGVLRDWTAVFEKENWHVAIHHFIDETPLEALVGKDSGICIGEIIGDEETPFEVITLLQNKGFTHYVPEQAFTDAFILDTYGNVHNWHYDSPKHKLQLWAKTEGAQLLVEFFCNMPFAPYGVNEYMNFPALDLEFVQDTLFDMELPDKPKKKKAEQGEIIDFAGIPEQIPPDVLKRADEAIERVFNDHRKIAIAYSGGKDSTVILLLVFRYLLKHPESKHDITIISADVLVDNPLIINHLMKMKEAVEAYCRKIGRKIPFILVEPEIGQDYFSCVLGKGYAPPSSKNRWCVERMKIIPAQKKLVELFGEGEPTCQLLGTRSSESENRARSMEKIYGDDFYSPHTVSNITTASPIRDWTAENVVTFLVREQAPWDELYSNYRLISLYGSASSFGECPIGAAITSDNDAKCSGRSARFGCFTCTLVDDDVSLRNLTLDYPELLPHYEYRGILKATQDLRYGGFTGYQRKPKFTITNGFGDLTIDIRTMLLLHLKRLEIKLSDNIVTSIYQEVMKREISEGIAVTNRFRQALFSHYTVSPLFTGAMYNPIFDPFNCGVDRRTEEDAAAIERVLARIAECKRKETSEQLALF
ncbi:phosphoadenosine phosphosulfate reductase domain-containing protein [Aneurinibacillus tyrosinisolvens]|uniref:phosphoadenosine phosphosulfate reductase domain-containing protein n=1 Tax=Aneurinibacillus tyrosinisolvens TaxID=1443435 RepID=UPI00063F140A|nr:phosphoadenosine phosphosulfate reductase family protein [Aneurinibacillus tyrosinisolvens]